MRRFPLCCKQALWALGLLLPVAGAQAQALPPGVRLGMSADALRAALPEVAPVQRPQRLAGGLTGSWRAPPSVLAGLPFEATFFFAGSELQRVEYVAATQAEADRGAATYAQLLDWGRSAYGTEASARDPGSAYASWVAGDTDVYLQHVDSPQRASVRLVYKLRQLRDGSAL